MTFETLTLLRFVVAALATWRLTSLLLIESGPFNLFVWWRTLVGRVAGLRALTTCMWCLSLWVGLVASVMSFTPLWVLMLPFALSAAAILVARGVSNNV